MSNEQGLTHLNDAGNAEMVDIADKDTTARTAIAETWVMMRPETRALILSDGLPKGDVLATARIAGIMAAKKTSDLIPLCHPLQLSKVSVDFEFPTDQPDLIRIEALAKLKGKTGVEMEALTAATVAALTLYDMCKAVDKGMVIQSTKLLFKDGGKSGTYKA